MTDVFGNAGYPGGGMFDAPDGEALESSVGLSTIRRHPIKEKATFEQLQRNAIVEARPQVLHFGGFQIHKQHVAKLKIVNISSSSERITIIEPETPYFKVSCDKKGLLAPGMSEDISVVFEPHEWKYYYDAVKIFCGDRAENLVVPIHAYPSANSLTIPKIVDFGRVALGTSRTKVIPLSCTIPVQFEFEIEIVEPHPDFGVTPLSGVIPADGTQNVVITYLPTSFATASIKLRFDVSQFDFEPVTVTICGNCHPDLVHAEVLKNGQADLVAATKQQLQDSMTDKVKTLRAKRVRGSIEAVPARYVYDHPERMVDGVKVPTTVNQQATNFVLNQTAGKLPLKDLSAFIGRQREAAERRRQRAEASVEGSEEEDEGDDIQARELRFDLQYRDVAKYDKEKELNSRVARGEDERSAEEIAAVVAARDWKEQRLKGAVLRNDIERLEPVKRTDTVSIPASYIHGLKPDWDQNANNTFGVRLQLIDRFVRAGSKLLMRMRIQKTAAALREAMRAAGTSAKDKTACRAWIDAENKAAAAGGLAAKSRPKQRASIVAAPTAAEAAADASGDEAAAAGAGAGTAAAAAAAAAAAEGGDDDAPEAIDFVRIPLDICLPTRVPVSGQATSVEARVAVEVFPLGDFIEFPAMKLNDRLDYKVLDYPEQHALPPPAAYMRPNDGSRSRLFAALEDHSVRGPAGDIGDGAEKPLSMPAVPGLEVKSHADALDALSLFIPSPQCRNYVAFPEFTECDTEYRLSLRPPTLEKPRTEPLLPENVMSVEALPPWLSTWRRRRLLQDPFMHFDPFPASFCEAGGSHGPRIGFDAGGERLSFMPVGGYSRDIPSDTDDDDRQDLENYDQTKPPAQEDYDLAMQSLDAPIDCRRWRLEREREALLAKRCEENSKAARERLRALNKDLSYGCKLYLG
eukprot:TRINITY_DN2604_c0_g4_i1.p1 TRINITY_DN2604_c0_g4~~TRINITY_DN2604_c0_g4_i1.p1  ORF type:complete len:917 (+),score=244.77 TRINITY_DN2604_c0_g4_i1:165-2915(+)